MDWIRNLGKRSARNLSIYAFCMVFSPQGAELRAILRDTISIWVLSCQGFPPDIHDLVRAGISMTCNCPSVGNGANRYSYSRRVPFGPAVEVEARIPSAPIAELVAS